MKNQTFLLKDIRPNPCRDLKKYPLQEERIASAMESITAAGWLKGSLTARINSEGKPQIIFGHHRVEALKRLGFKEIDLNIEPMSDGVMLQRMSRENKRTENDSVSTAAFYREMIEAFLKLHGEGGISAEEMSIDPKTNKNLIRYAPGFGCLPPAASIDQHPYTIEGSASYLGAVKETGAAVEDFKAAFGAVELIRDGCLTESKLANLPLWKVGMAVNLAKKDRDDAAKKLKYEEEARQKELATLREREEATQRKVEAERLASVKRAEALNNEAARKEALRKAEEIRKANNTLARQRQAAIDKEESAAAKKSVDAQRELKTVKTNIKEKVNAFLRDTEKMPRSKAREYVNEIKGKEVKPTEPTKVDSFFKDVIDDINNHQKNGSPLIHRLERDKTILKIARKLVTTGMRKLAEVAHPDHGGTQDDMELLNSATQLLRTYITKKEEENAAFAR